jgi:hypothetical protein
MNRRTLASSPSATDRADQLVKSLLAERPNMGNVAALLNQLARESRTVQSKVLDKLRGPKKIGAPKALITDEDWLRGVESWREVMASANPNNTTAPTELAVIRDWVKNTETRSKRQPGDQRTEAEVKRIRDACVRARSNRKKAA